MTEERSSYDDFIIGKENINRKMSAGHFWFTQGAIADAEKTAALLLRQGNVLTALSLLIEVHTKARDRAEEILAKEPTMTFCREWRNTSQVKLWALVPTYKLCRVILFLGSL